VSTATEVTAAAPIADVSYRSYDGPLRAHPLRFWIIARMMARLAVRRKGFWVLAVLAALPYVFPMFQLYIAGRDPTGAMKVLFRQPFNGLFYDAFAGFGGAGLWLFLTALLAGAASIAGDFRTNALQIYLSKPVTRLDYLFGKWGGIFVVVGGVALIPALVFFIYCWASFNDQGFSRDQPYLWLQMLVVTLLPAVLHASLLVGFSAWLKRPLLAGGIYAALYFGGGILVDIIAIILRESHREHEALVVKHLSLPGLLSGIAQHVYRATPSFFGMRMPGSSGERPDLMPMAAMFGALCVAGLIAAFVRVRAVEVVRG
jgi:ABC-2 type transport system permease protein